MTMTRPFLIAVLLIVPTVVAARQQAPAQPAPATPPATPPAGAQASPPQPEAAKGTAKPAYAYDPAGRRDPFVSLLGRGGDTQQQQAARPSGVSGLMIGEVTVKGVLRDKSGFLAMLRAPDNKTYTVRVGDRLLDGSVKSINQDKVIFSQDVNDPLSLVKQREVPKPVRQAEGRGE
jgi:type IV pilus assembly protein PilP